MSLRENNIEKLAGGKHDVLILGGGINGAVCASALTTMGARVALIDRGDFAGATSQESSNLVWGGIKYLEGVELGLVRKLCVSRNQLIRTYPSSVKEVRFFTTLATGFRWGRLSLYVGTLLYWLLGSFSTRGPRLLSKAQIRAEEPTINLEGMAGGFEYSDAYLVDNDARFVFNFIRAAIDHGGIVANYVESRGATRSEDGWWSTQACDLETGREFEIRSKVILNACGPLVDAHNTITGQAGAHRHVFSKGVHLLVDRITPITRVLTFFADDGRLFFILPMGPKSCIGTTDTRVEELPAKVTPEDRRFILDNVNHLLDLEKPLTEADIIAERCGVRPLVIDAQGRDRDEGDWTSLSRKHAIEANMEESHISIFGGKLTDCLNVGEEVAELVHELGVALPYRGRSWYGEPPNEVRDEYFHQAILMGLDAMTAPESSELLSTRLWRRYGASALRLLEDIREEPAMAEVLIKGTEYIRAEIHHAARREMIVKLEDFLRRRSKIALIERTETIRNAPGLMEACRILFGSAAEDRIKEYFEGGERQG
ncbi:MAG: glycerol-3-phosphate dehydrogenase/oxidase [Deltaproteobacteria bacterium]|nr:glycerol-3-phosphate dehydrogenase/oxidase [Deltaproteobacteria bacterium]